jgi:hypothetical protein
MTTIRGSGPGADSWLARLRLRAAFGGLALACGAVQAHDYYSA